MHMNKKYFAVLLDSFHNVETLSADGSKDQPNLHFQQKA